MYMNILVPVSFDQERDAGQALQVAQKLAGPGARITLFHVMEHIPAYALSYMSQEYLDDARKAIDVELGKMAERLENGAAVVVEGHSGRTILDWSEENGVDCIVIASHRPGMQDYLLGSTAAHVVRHAGCSVHVVRG